MDFTTWYSRYCTDSTLKYPSKRTHENYQCSVKLFLDYFKNEVDPSHIKTQSIKDWLLTFETINTRNHKLCAIKSFYQLTVGMPLKLEKIPFSKKDKKLPEVIEENEIQAIFEACENLKHKTIIAILYACGLRVGELINLKIENIKENTIDIKLAKGRKDRIVPMPENLKTIIENYKRQYKPNIYLFNGQNNSLQYTEASIRQFLNKYALLAGIKRNIHPHLFRHSYATHSLEQGVGLHFLKEILGHNNPKTTAIYLHTSRKSIGNVHSPFSNLKI